MNRKEEHAGTAAFFDLDGTLLALPSLERRFFGMLRSRRAVPARNYFAWLKEGLRLLPRGITAILQANKMHLGGLPEKCIELDGLKPGLSFFEDAINRVAWHAKQRHAIVLLSGTLEHLAKQAAHALETELAKRGIFLVIRVCATRLEEREGRWTGRILGEAMFGAAKLRAMQEIAKDMHLDLSQCYAYGDRASDKWQLAAVGRPTAVNPDDDLARLARISGWPILSWNEHFMHKGRDRSGIAESGLMRSESRAAFGRNR